VQERLTKQIATPLTIRAKREQLTRFPDARVGGWPQVQERLTKQIATALNDKLAPREILCV